MGTPLHAVHSAGLQPTLQEEGGGGEGEKSNRDIFLGMGYRHVFLFSSSGL